MIRPLLATSLFIAMTAAAMALTPRPSPMEPAEGSLPPGQKVLVDDGTCPRGQIKQVIGGDMRSGGARIRTCIRRP